MPTVIVDRDGVINRDSARFIKTPDEWQPLPGSIQAIAGLCAAGFRVAIASNQSGVGRGLLDAPTLDAIHQKMLTAIGSGGGRIATTEYCPHSPDADCECRKPKPGLLRRIGDTLGIDLTNVPCIGDSRRDIEAALAVGARPILVLTGNGRRTLEEGLDMDIEVYHDLKEAAEELIQELQA
jgi:D-glycero-D-manno-heptose 1,7-bisphosphate phosphatase